MANALNWFEIPVKNFEKAKKFYETVLNAKLEEMEMPGGKYAMLPFDQEAGHVGGGLMQSEGFEPSNKGTVVYLNAMPDLSDALSRVEAAGGKIIVPKMAIGPNGFMAHFIDTEGNRVALHSMS